MIQARRAHSTTRDAVSKRHAIFVEEYIANGGNAVQAARKAGYGSGGGEVLKRHPELREQIAERRAQLVKEAEARAGLSVQVVVDDLKAAHAFDPRRYFNADGTHKHPAELTLEDARQLEGWEVEEVYSSKGRGKAKQLLAVRVVKVRIAKRIAVRDQGMRHLGLYAKDNAQRTPGSPEEVAAAVRAALRQIDQRTGGKP